MSQKDKNSKPVYPLEDVLLALYAGGLVLSVVGGSMFLLWFVFIVLLPKVCMG